MDKRTFSEAIKRIIVLFPDKDLPVTLMWDYLNDLSDRDFIRAVDAVILNSEQINKATNLIAVIRKYANEADGYTAELAWEDVLTAARSFGAPVRIKNDAMAHALRCVGYDRIRMSEDVSFDRHMFIQAYKSYSEHSDKKNMERISEARVKGLVE